jgi:hypothetical protein
MGQYQSVLSMMRSNQASTAGVPTQTFGASNILGTAVPAVGDSTPRPDYVKGVNNAGTKQIIVVVLVLFAVGYLLYHFNFET